MQHCFTVRAVWLLCLGGATTVTLLSAFQNASQNVIPSSVDTFSLDVSSILMDASSRRQKQQRRRLARKQRLMMKDSTEAKDKEFKRQTSWWLPCEVIDSKNNHTQDLTEAEPTLLATNKTVHFFHPGKSGGGTVVERTTQCWRMRTHEICHPSPRPCLSKPDFDPQNGVIITVRDPIDRFVSSFYWRLHVTCGIGDKRQLNRGATRDTQKFCKRPNPGEGKAFRRYNKSASFLAESLCSSNETLQQETQWAIQRIQHANFALHHFLDFSWTPKDLFPIVTERGVTDLEGQVDASLQWIYERHAFETQQAFQNRSLYAGRRRVAGSLTHSSASHRKEALSPRAEQCLAQYYRKDYSLLQTLLDESACKTNDCHRGLESILDRRKHLLEPNNATP